jgi:hypothetical protein
MTRKQQRQLERIKNACGEDTTKTQENVEKTQKTKKCLKAIKKGNNNHLKEKKER